jgi:hypothetical protein
MASVETYQKRLQDGIAAVENEINAHNQQIEVLTKRLEGLKRAVELFRSDQAAVTELLRTSLEGGVGPLDAHEPQAARPGSATKVARNPKLKGRNKPATVFARSSRPRRQLGAREQKAAREHLDKVRQANRDDKVKRTDLIAAVLEGTPEMTVQEIITALNKEFGWKCTESNLTGHLYTNQKMFTHTAADRVGKNPIRWSLN